MLILNIKEGDKIMKIQTKMLKRLIAVLCAATMVASGAIASVGAIGEQDSIEQLKKELNEKELILRILQENSYGVEEEDFVQIEAEIKTIKEKIERKQRENIKKAKAEEIKTGNKKANFDKAKGNLKKDTEKFEKLNKETNKVCDRNECIKPEKSVTYKKKKKNKNIVKRCESLKNKIKENEKRKKTAEQSNKGQKPQANKGAVAGKLQNMFDEHGLKVGSKVIKEKAERLEKLKKNIEENKNRFDSLEKIFKNHKEDAWNAIKKELTFKVAISTKAEKNTLEEQSPNETERENRLKQLPTKFKSLFSGNQWDYYKNQQVKNTCLIYTITNFKNIQDFIDGKKGPIIGIKNVINNYNKNKKTGDIEVGKPLEPSVISGFLANMNVGLFDFSYFEAVKDMSTLNQTKQKIKNILVGYMKNKLFAPVSVLTQTKTSSHWVLLAQYDETNDNITVFDSNFNDPTTKKLDDILNELVVDRYDRTCGSEVRRAEFAFLTKGGQCDSNCIMSLDELDEQKILGDINLWQKNN